MFSEKVILLPTLIYLVTYSCSLANNQWVLIFKSKVTTFNYHHTQK